MRPETVLSRQCFVSHGVMSMKFKKPTPVRGYRGVPHIGPPQRLPLPAGYDISLGADRSGRIVAQSARDRAFVTTPEGTVSVGPLQDCRSVTVSPDGQWLATGSHGVNGFQIWRIRDATKVAEVPIDGLIRSRVQPGRALADDEQLAVPALGNGHLARARQIGGAGLCFSADSRFLAVRDASKAILLVETETGRTLARFESPDQCTAGWAAFSPDGSRLALTTSDGPAVHVWDLRASARNWLAWASTGMRRPTRRRRGQFRASALAPDSGRSRRSGRPRRTLHRIRGRRV